jgi:phosphoribosylanthranilate isomerase
LTPRNVGEAIRAAQPYAVDVCSGVEAKPGKKDAARMKDLMRAVKSAQRRKR